MRREAVRIVPAWAVPASVGGTAGVIVACAACRCLLYDVWDAVPLSAIPPRGIVATNCPNPCCRAWISAELAPNWGAHAARYPDWLVDRLVDLGLLVP
ncbi:MAG: hypothetical protein NZ761_12705 [Dehalococcoidia bacterium]|nr:hypothetical protein [Dehalococcoidia bacterium]